MNKAIDPRITDLFDRHGQVITVSDADLVGVPRESLRRAERRQQLVRVGRSAFVRGAELIDAEPWEAFRLRSIGFVLGLAQDVSLCGPSAQAVLSLPSVSEPPREPMARRSGWSHRGPDRSPHGRIRTGYLPEHHRWTRDRARVTSLAYTTVDTIRYAGPEEALVVMDHALRHDVTKEHLARIAWDMRNYPGIRRVFWAIEHGDARAESPLESMGRLSFIEAGRPAPLSNVWITDGRRAHRVDHLLPDSGVVLEGDGGLKLNNRPDAHRVIRDQIDRERWIRGQGFLLDRYDFPVARSRRWVILQRADAVARQRRERPVPTNWSFDPPAWVHLPEAG